MKLILRTYVSVRMEQQEAVLSWKELFGYFAPLFVPKIHETFQNDIEFILNDKTHYDCNYCFEIMDAHFILSQ